MELTDAFEKYASEVSKKRNEIVELFVKTFFSVSVPDRFLREMFASGKIRLIEDRDNSILNSKISWYIEMDGISPRMKNMGYELDDSERRKKNSNTTNE